MNILDIIAKKRDGKILSKDEIKYFIEGYTKGAIADYQAAALIMAIYIKGMSKQETTDLAISMAHSGEILDLSSFGKNIVDKHSTGGVGDKISLILLPLVASLGVPVAKMSGRGLGHTGGTVDKLESIPGYQTQIDMNRFIQNVENIGISLIAQTMNLAPADKKIYALRDVISCTESIPLIASSIMSKKIASGANKIVLDVTVGHGAFMKNIEDARTLSKQMMSIGKLAKRETVCVLTNMNEPLGYAIGNNLEVIEAINSLKGNIPEDIKQVVLELGSYMLKLAGKGNNIDENKNTLLRQIESGKAFEKWLQLVKNQNGDISYCKDTNKFIKAKRIEKVIANKTGYIYEINAEEIGKLACRLGAGREKKEDKIDPSVGIVLAKKVSDFVEKGEVIAYLHYSNKDENAKKDLEKIIKIQENKVEKPKIILEIIK